MMIKKKQKPQQDISTQSRRHFLGLTVSLSATALIAPGVFLYQTAQAKSDAEPASDKIRWGMLIDTNKCKQGCEDCVNACAKENGWQDQIGPNEVKVQWIRKVDLTHKNTKRQVSLPIMCQHCEKPPCVDVCPTGASFKRADGIVLVDKHICIGCRYCMMACPYKARSFVHSPVKNHDSYMPRGMGTVESCTYCVHLIDKDQSPACVSACQENAILFGNLNDAQTPISQKLTSLASRQIRADLGANPSVFYHGI